MSTRRSNRWRAGIKYTAVSLFALPWVVLPLWLMVVNSFKTSGDAGLVNPSMISCITGLPVVVAVISVRSASRNACSRTGISCARERW